MTEDWRFARFRDVAQLAASLPAIRRIASQLTGVGAGVGPHSAALVKMPFERRRLVQCAALLEYVQRAVAFERSAFVSPVAALRSGRGDCKSSATLLAALALSIGCDTRLVPLGWTHEPSHVVVQLRPFARSPWLWAEATIPGAKLGEHPTTALRRTKQEGRTDLGN